MIDRALESFDPQHASTSFEADLTTVLAPIDLTDEAEGTRWDGLATAPRLWRDTTSMPAWNACVSPDTGDMDIRRVTSAPEAGPIVGPHSEALAPALDAALLPRATRDLPRPPPCPFRGEAGAYTRTLTNDMALRVLYIPLDMHSYLCLGDMYPRRTDGRRLRSSIVQLVLAKEARPFQVTMVQSSNCRHRRFTAGWRAFCRSADLRIGDVLTFKRGRSANQLLVVVCKQQGGGDRENREPLVAAGCH